MEQDAPPATDAGETVMIRRPKVAIIGGGITAAIALHPMCIHRADMLEVLHHGLSKTGVAKGGGKCHCRRRGILSLDAADFFQRGVNCVDY